MSSYFNYGIARGDALCQHKHSRVFPNLSKEPIALVVKRVQKETVFCPRIGYPNVSLC